jgi:hypothetical protein
MDVDLDIVGSYLPALEAERRKCIRGALCGIAFGVVPS